MKKLTDEQVEKINAKIEYEGFEYWLSEYAYEHLEGSDLEIVLEDYKTARRSLERVLVSAGIDIL